jgi:hypothetical protein
MPDKEEPVPFVDFFNGGVDIICGGDIDDRGDINVNGTANEIADAVLFSNYFVYGLGVFATETMDAQIAATDVNADGLTLSVADLVYLVRIIVGDAIPYAPGPTSYKVGAVDAAYTFANGMLTVDSKIGAAYVVVSGEQVPTNLTDVGMEYAFDGTNTRILLASLDRVASFDGAILEVGGEIVSIETATPDGGMMKLENLPASYELIGNYPNPFNPTTTVAAALPQAGDYTLTIYNVTGQKVAEFAGHADAGILEVEWNAASQASGVYFYKLNVNNFTETKKMVLLK